MVRVWQTIQKNCVVAGWGFTAVSIEDRDETYSNSSVYIKALATRLLPPMYCLLKTCRSVLIGRVFEIGPKIFNSAQLKDLVQLPHPTNLLVF